VPSTGVSSSGASDAVWRITPILSASPGIIESSRFSQTDLIGFKEAILTCAPCCASDRVVSRRVVPDDHCELCAGDHQSGVCCASFKQTAKSCVFGSVNFIGADLRR